MENLSSKAQKWTPTTASSCLKHSHRIDEQSHRKTNKWERISICWMGRGSKRWGVMQPSGFDHPVYFTARKPWPWRFVAELFLIRFAYIVCVLSRKLPERPSRNVQHNLNRAFDILGEASGEGSTYCFVTHPIPNMIFEVQGLQFGSISSHLFRTPSVSSVSMLLLGHQGSHLRAQVFLGCFEVQTFLWSYSSAQGPITSFSSEGVDPVFVFVYNYSDLSGLFKNKYNKLR